MIQTKVATFEKYPAYKDSGVEWLGEIPSHWELGRLGTILKPISIKNRADLPLLSITREEGVIERDIENEGSNHNFIPDDLSGYKVIQKGQFGMNKMKAWQGSYGISRYTGIVSPAYYVFDFNSDINPEFFHYAVRSKNYVSFFGQASDGVRIGQWDLSQTRMKEIPLFIPKYEEQTTIANFLDNKTSKIDTAIAQKEQMIALLKERKQIVIQNAVTKGLNPNAKMKDLGVEWIGEIPKGWEVKKTKHFGTIKSGEGITNSELNEHGRYEVFGGNGLMGYSDRYNIDDECIIIGRVGALCGNVRLSKGKRFISDNALIFKSNKKSDTEYLRVVLTFADLNKLNTSNAQPLITGTKVMNQQFPFPDNDERLQILNLIESQSTKIDQAISLQQSQIEKLKEYKATLIDGAVTGKIRVNG